MASYSLNRDGVDKARKMIEAAQYVIDSEWSDAQPTTDQENEFLERHGYELYGEWHLGLTDDATPDTKGRYAFVFGDFRRVHRMGLIACRFRAAQWHHKAVELAAHDLLQQLDDNIG